MKVRALMTSPVVTVRPAAALRDVAAILRDRQISAVPVVDADSRLLGLVSEGDLLPLELADPRSQATPEQVPEHAPHTAGDVMTTEVIAVDPDFDAGEAAQLMAARRLRHVPVLAGGRVVGMLSRRDLIGMLSRGDGELQADIEELLRSELGRSAPAVHVHEGELEVELAEDASTYPLVKVLAASIPGVVAVRGR